VIKTDVNIAETYESCTANVSLKLYNDLNKAFNQFIVNRVIEGERITLPAKLGSVYIGGTKRKKLFNEDGVPLLPPDWGATKKLWAKNPEAKKKKTILRHTNEHTGGVSYRFIWSKKDVPIPNKVFMSFRLTNANKKKVSKAIKKGKEYIINKIVD